MLWTMGSCRTGPLLARWEPRTPLRRASAPGLDARLARRAYTFVVVSVLNLESSPFKLSPKLFLRSWRSRSDASTVASSLDSVHLDRLLSLLWLWLRFFTVNREVLDSVLEALRRGSDLRRGSVLHRRRFDAGL